jgi:hypothetical protein
VEVIFSDVTPDHQKWQMFHHTMFRWAVLNTISLRILYSKNKLCYNDWKAMTKREQLKQVNLRGLVDIAIHGGGPFNTGRRQDSKIATTPTKVYHWRCCQTKVDC